MGKIVPLKNISIPSKEKALSEVNPVIHLGGNNKVLATPKVAIVIVIGRPRQEWYLQALGSAQNQYYNNFEIIEIENVARDKTIAKCCNLAAQNTDAEFLYYLGDDDFISNDLIHSHVAFHKFNKSTFGIDAIFVGSGVQLVNEKSELLGHRLTTPHGFWKKDFLLKHPFNEELTKLEDKDLQERAKEMGAPMIFMDHYFGYYYRQHNAMNSGRKDQ